MMKKFMITTILFAAATSCASSSAGYYRVWQGFKRTDMDVATFNQKLPAFMTATRDIYKGVLNNYLVALPPEQKPSFVPDEFALVAIRSEQDYKEIRATSAGQAYSEAHWTVFNKENSKSAPYSSVIPKVLEHNQAYDLIGQAIDWREGHTTFFIGLKKEAYSSEQFLTWLASHTQEVASLKSQGLNGYIVIANDKYEVAFMNWSSKAARDLAFSTDVGQKVRAESAQYMDRLMFKEATPFDLQTVNFDHFYNTDPSFQH